MPLLSSPSSEGCRGSRQGSPVSSKYLWERSLIRFGSLLMHKNMVHSLWISLNTVPRRTSSTTHPCCRSLLQGKVCHRLPPIVKNPQHRSCQRHTGRSNSWRRLQECERYSRKGSSGIQRGCKVGQGEGGLGKGTLNLVRNLLFSFDFCLQKNCSNLSPPLSS